MNQQKNYIDYKADSISKLDICVVEKHHQKQTPINDCNNREKLEDDSKEWRCLHRELTLDC